MKNKSDILKFDYKYETYIDYKNHSFDVVEYEIGKYTNEVSRMRIETREKMVVDGLIKLGWTPPPGTYTDEESKNNG